METSEFQWEGWTVRACHAPILKTSRVSTAENSAARWSQELGLTRFVNQDLPIIYGSNSLELRHEPSGVRISFCALEGLRAWAYLDHKAVPHLVQSAMQCERISDQAPRLMHVCGVGEWDYTFTTPYAGATAVAPLGAGVPARPNDSSVVKRSAVNLATGKARLRSPLCKCKVLYCELTSDL